MGTLRGAFGDPPDVVSFTGITEVVDGQRRVYLTPEVDAWVEFPDAAGHHVADADGIASTVWVNSREPVTFRALGVEGAGYLDGPIADGRLTFELRASGLVRHLGNGLRGLCLSKSPRTPRRGLRGAWRGPGPAPFRPGSPDR